MLANANPLRYIFHHIRWCKTISVAMEALKGFGDVAGMSLMSETRQRMSDVGHFYHMV